MVSDHTRGAKNESPNSPYELLGTPNLVVLPGCYESFGGECPPMLGKCASEDYDGDGVLNGDDSFPADGRCWIRGHENCGNCGDACGTREVCDRGLCVCAGGCAEHNGPGECAFYWPDEIEVDCCWCWSSSVDSNFVAAAWGVGFPRGGVSYNYSEGYGDASRVRWARYRPR